MFVVSSVARFKAGHLAVLCFPVKGNWATADPLRKTRAMVESNMRGIESTFWSTLAAVQCTSRSALMAGDGDPARLGCPGQSSGVVQRAHRMKAVCSLRFPPGNK